MNYIRLYSALLCALFISVPQTMMAGFAGEIADMSAEDLTAEIGTMSDKDIAALSEDDMEALANRMAELSKDNKALFENLLKDDSKLATNPAFEKFQQTFKDQTEAIQNAVGREGEITDLISNAKEGNEGGLDALRKTNQTRDMLSNVQKDFQKGCIDKSKSVMKQFAKDLKMGNKELADKYLAKVGKEGPLADEINGALKNGDRKALVTACAKVAREEALGAVGDIKNMIKNFGEEGAISDVGTTFLTDAETKLGSTWNKFTEDAVSGKDFNEVVEPGKTTPGEAGPKGIPGAGEETAGVTALDKFFNDDFGRLEKQIGDNFNDNMGKLDAADARIAKDSDIDLNSYTTKFRTKTFLRNPVNAIKESLSEFGTALKRTNIRDLASDAAENIAGKFRSIGGRLGMVIETLVSAVLFMIPNIFQSAYLAQQEKATALATWGRPVEYGGKVWQIPDWCINLNNPSASIPLYVQIPVNSAGEEINATLAKMFPGLYQSQAKLTNPNTSNPISDAIHNASSDIWSFGSTLETTINRYQFTDEFLKYTDVAVMYGSPTSMAPTGTAHIGGSEFTGQMISLKTGQVFDGTGENINATGVPQAQGIPLINGENPTNIWGLLQLNQSSPAGQGQLTPLATTYANLIAKMETLGINVTFTQYSDVGSGSQGANVAKSETDYFDTSCIDESTGAIKDPNCSCLLIEGLTDLQNGLNLDENGKVANINPALTPSSGTKAPTSSPSKNVSAKSSSTLTAPTPPSSDNKNLLEWQGLGNVTPVFGWGETKYQSIIGSVDATGKVASGVFKGFNASNVNFGGISKVVTNADGTSATQREYADSDTVWAAQGCWIYLCSQTPFIKALLESNSTLTLSNIGSLTDYIVFMDEDLNIVPLMTPETVTITYLDGSTEYTYQTSQLTLNSVIKYWTSLVFYNQPYFLYEGNSIMYDLQGNKYKASELGAPAGGKQSSGGIITSFLQGAKATDPSIASNYPDIFNQYSMHSQALLYKFQELGMTYGGIGFSQSEYSLNIQGQSLPTYTAQKGMSCLGTANVSDLFVAMDGNMNPIALPNENVVYMQSLVTDITYELDSTTNTWSVAQVYPPESVQQQQEGSTVSSSAKSSSSPITTGYSGSPLKLDNKTQMPILKSDGSYEIDQQGSDSNLQNLGMYLGITNPTQDGTLQSPVQQGSLTINTTAANDTADAAVIKANEKLIKYVQKQRLQWLAALDDVVYIGTGGNAKLANLANTITTGYAKTNRCYVYEINPNPSFVSTDYFVVVNTQSPTLASLTQTVDLKKITKGSKATIVSLLTGAMYDLNGNQIMNKNSLPKLISVPDNLYASGKSTAEIIYDTFTKKFANLPTVFTQSYQSIVETYVQSEMLPKGPYSFGKYKVAIRSADDQSYNFVYFDAAQMTKSTIVPTDMYIIVDADTFTPTSYDSSRKQLLISLITGITVDQNGMIVNKLLPSNVQNFINIMQPGWSLWIKENVARLQAGYKARQAQMQEDQKNLEDRIAEFTKTHDAALNKDQSTISQIIKNLQPAGAGLPVPYTGLQYDKVSGNYVHPSPLQQNELIYLFMGTGKVYAQNGEYRSKYQPAHIQAVRDEYGVVVDAKTGKQKLGIPMMQPTIVMDPDDVDIVLGQSGKSLVASGSPEFPGEMVVMPKGYGLYFSKIMNTYYVLDSKNDRWMSVDGGHVYQKNGQPVIDGNSVALSKNNIPLLLYKNKDGFMQAYMVDGSDYANVSESNAAMTWLGLNEPFHQYTVTTNVTSAEAIPAQYTIESSKQVSTTYTVNKNYTWNMLVLVPITDAGQLLSNIPDSSYQYVQAVKDKNGQMTHIVYHGTAYAASITGKTAKGSGTVYTFKPMQTTENSVASITVTDGLIDPNTTAPYMVINDGVNKYKYAYVPKSYTTEEQETNRIEIIGGVTSSSPLPIAVGPMHEVSNGNTVPDYVTHVLFEADLPVKNNKVQVTPVAIQSVYNVPTQNPEAEEFAYKFTAGKSGFGGVFKTSETNPRFVYKIAGSVSKASPSTMTFDYISKDAYVDLKTAAVYDATTGQALGQCLTMNDFLSVLDACSVSVSNKTLEIKDTTGKVTNTINKKGQNMLVYRSVAVAQQQEQNIESQAALATN